MLCHGNFEFQRKLPKLRQIKPNYMKKIIRRSLLILTLVLVAFIVKTLYEAGVFKSIKSRFAGTEKVIKVAAGGAEDITINQQTGIAYISADARCATLAGKPNPAKGTIYWLDVKNPDALPIDMLPDFKPEFHPHGISYFKTKSGKELLFVVNHTKQNTTQKVERFEIRGKKLVHIETIQHKLMNLPNDLVAVNERQFYVTNDHKYLKGFGRVMEEYLRLPYGSVNFYDGKTMTKVADGITYANGINTSLNGKTVFVTSPTNNQLFVFDRKADNTLTQVESIKTGTGADNIELDTKGNLWMGCHPKLFSFVAHSKNPKKKAPSEVIKMSYQSKGVYDITSVYMNDGNNLSASSAAAVYKDNLLIGGVFDKRFVWGKMVGK